jgi:hypothetical protein
MCRTQSAFLFCGLVLESRYTVLMYWDLDKASLTPQLVIRLSLAATLQFLPC